MVANIGSVFSAFICNGKSSSNKAKFEIVNLRNCVKYLASDGLPNNEKIRICNVVSKHLEKATNSAFYKAFLTFAIPKLLTVLESSRAEFIFDLGTEELRNLILNIMDHLPVHMLEPFVEILLLRLQSLLPHDNEENVLISLRIIIKLQNEFRPSLNYQAKLLEFMESMYKVMLTKVHKIFVPRITNIIEIEDTQQLIYENFTRRTVRVLDGDAQMARTVHLVPKGVFSLKVLQELALVINSLDEKYGYCIKSYIGFIMDIIVLEPSAEERQNPAFCKDNFEAFIAVQVKSISLIARVANRHHIFLKEYHTVALIEGLLNLLILCPPGLVSLRRCLLAASKEIFAGELRQIFAPFMGGLLDKPVLLGRGRTSQLSLLAPVHTLMVDMIFRMGLKMDSPGLTKAVYVLSKGLLDINLPKTLQKRCCQLLPVLSAYLTSNSSNQIGATESQRITLIITDTFLTKLKMISKHDVPALSEKTKMTGFRSVEQYGVTLDLVKELILGLRIVSQMRIASTIHATGELFGQVCLAPHEAELYAGLVKWALKVFDLFQVKVNLPVSEEQQIIWNRKKYTILQQFGLIYSTMATQSLQELLTKTFTYLVSGISRNPHIKFVLLQLLTNKRTNPISVNILIKYLRSHMINMGSSPITGSCYLKLFKLLFQCAVLYPKECNIIIKPYLKSVVVKCLKLFTCSSYPLYYLKLLITIIRRVGHENHEGLQKVIQTILPNILQFLTFQLHNNQLNTDINCLITELSLIIAIKLNCFKPYLSIITSAIISGLNGSEKLISLALETLELYLNAVEYEEFSKHLQTVKTALFHPLWKLLQGRGLNSQIAFSILGKFGGENRDVLSKGPSSLAHETNFNPTSFIIGFKKYERPVHIPLKEILETANLVLRQKNLSTFYLEQAWNVINSYLAASIALGDDQSGLIKLFSDPRLQDLEKIEKANPILYRTTFTSARKNHQMALIGMFIAATVDELHELVRPQLVSVVRHHTLAAATQQIDNCRTPNSIQALSMDGLVLVDALAFILGQGDDSLYKLGCATLMVIFDTVLTLLKDKELIYHLPFIKYLWATLGALCYEPCSASKAGGCIAIGFMLRQFSREWVADHVDFVSEPLFHVLVDLTGQVCYGVQNAAMAGLELVLDILTISGTCDHKTDDELTKALDYFTLETVSRTVNSDVLSRKHSILLLRLLAKKRRRNLPSVINPFKAVIGVVIPCVPDFKELSDNVKIGILEGNLLYASLYRRIFPVDMGSRKQIDFLADLSLLCNSSEKELKKYDCYTNNQDIALLRKYALRLLATYYRLPVVRDSIFCILYKTMDEPNVELQQTAFECLRKQIAAYSYNMELAKNAVKPLLDTLSNVSSLTIRGLTTMSFSAELFPEIFTELFFKAICNRLNQLMVNESHHGPHIHDYLTPTIEDDKMQKISKALTILYKASKSSPRFVADVCMCTFKAKKIMFMEIERPLTTNFWKYLSSHVSHTLHFLMSDIMLVKPQCNHLLKLLLKQQSLGRPFRNYIKAKMVHRLLEMLAVDPKANCRLPRSEVHFQAIRIISYLVGFDDGWLATQPILVKSLKGIWRDPLYLEQHRTVSSLLHSHWEEPNLLVKLLLNYFCSNKSKHIKLLFQSLKLTCFPHVRSIEFLYDFLSQTVKSSSVCWRRRAFYKFVDLLSSNDIMQEIKSKIVDLILIPSFNICFVQGETHNLIAGHMMPEYGNLNHIVAVFIDCLSNCHIPEADQLHGSLLRLGCLVVTKAKYCIEDHSSENYNEWLEGLRSYVLLCLGNTSVDPSVRPLGHLLLSLLIANFRTGESFAKELFYSLLTTNTFETPILVRRTCEVLLMIVPIHLIADWTEKILLQSSPNIQVLMPVLQFIIHQKEAFFPFRHLLSRPVVTCIQHLSSGPETRFVHKKCRILLAKTVTNWNDRRRIKHAEEDLQATGVEERLIEKSIFEMVIRFLIRCICDRSAYMAGHLASNDIMLLSHSCVDLLKAILNQAQSRSVDIRLGVFIKSFPKMAPTKIGAPSQCMILELLIRFVTMVRPQWIIKYLRNMQYYVATCLQSPNISIMKRVYNLARQFSIRSPDQNFSVLNESFFCTAHEVVDGFGGLVESNPLELFNTLRFVKEVSTIKRSLHNLSIEKILSILSEAKTIHLDRHVPETLYVTSELIIYCLEILVAEVEANQSTASENFLFTVLEELVLHTQSRALLEYVLKLLAEKLIFKMDDLLDSQIKLLLKLRRTLNTIFSEDEGFQKEFYTVVLRIASTWKISNSDLRRDMQGLFWEGMRSSRHLVRKKFSVALEPVVNQYLFDRLAFIVTIPIWNSTQHYWVTPWIELLLKRTANEQIPLNVSFESVVAEVTSALNPTFTNISENGDKSVLEMVERHFRFLKLRNNRSVNNILFGICQLCYIDKLLSKQVWLQLFPGIWSIFDQVEQSKLNKFAADNIDILEENLDKSPTCHGTQIVAFQQGPPNNDNTNLKLLPYKAKLDIPDNFHALSELHIHKGHKPKPNLENKNKIQEVKSDVEFIRNHNLSWVLCRMIDSESAEQPIVPQWTGFNKLLSPERHNITTYGYLPLLPYVASEYDTLWTTMIRCNNIANKLGSKYTVITFDQALYFKSKEVQWIKGDECSQFIFRMGGFHVMLNFLGVIGRHMEHSGLREIWLESGLYGDSTIAAIFKGKKWNKGIRAHKLTYEALVRILLSLFENWLSECQIESRKFIDEARQIAGELCDKMRNSETLELFHSIKTKLDGCREIFTEFINSLSPTSKYWVTYIEMVEVLLQFIFAERTGDWGLHLSSFRAMLPWFFCYDHTNYSRWGTVYLIDMLNLPDKAPEIYNEFMAGNFVVKRLSGSFNTISVDQAVEHVNKISKDAGGIVGLTKNSTRLDEWFLSFNKIGTMVNSFTESLRRKDKPYSQNIEIGKKRINVDNQSVLSLAEQFNRFNVFSTDGDILMCISTNVLFSPDLQKSLVCVPALGEQLLEDFIKSIDNDKFYAPIKKVKLQKKDSGSKPLKKKEKIKDQLKGQDILQKILAVKEMGRDISYTEVFKHELTHYPMALAPNGYLNTPNNKSSLGNILETYSNSLSTLPSTDKKTAHIFDGMSLVYALGKPITAKTFDQYGELYSNLIFKNNFNAQRIDVVMDHYEDQSIKTCTRSKRASSINAIKKVIDKGDVSMPQQWHSFIYSTFNKRELTDFLSSYMAERSRTETVEFATSGGFKDILQYYRRDNFQSDLLASTHEEADTRILLHILDAKNAGYKRCIITCRDTDVLVLLVHFKSFLTEEVWMQVGLGKQTRFIPIHEFKLDSHLALNLPAFHAVTCSDTTSQFVGYGKKKCWEVYLKHYHLLNDLGKGIIDQSLIDRIEQFVIKLYAPDLKGIDSVDSLRAKLAISRSLDKLPPTRATLKEHILRSHYQTKIWLNSFHPRPNLGNVYEHGWKLIGEQLVPVLQTENALPELLVVLSNSGCKKDCSKRWCSCRKGNMGCIDSCKCMRKCTNTVTTQSKVDHSSEYDYDSDESIE